MSNKRLILVPPSEGKALGGEVAGARTQPAFADDPLAAKRRTVAEALADTIESTGSRAQLAKLLGAKGDTLDRSIQADLELEQAPRLPAIERYDGVLYQHLDAPSLDGWATRRLSASLLIVSGLWGFLTPQERIPDYRLKMSASLKGLGKLSTFWRPALTEHLANYLSNAGRGAELWDLLPNEHSLAVSMPPRKVVNRAVFVQPDRSGEMKPVSHWNKAYKGTLVRFLVENPSAGPVDLLEWEHPGGFRLEPESLAVRNRIRQLVFVDQSRASGTIRP